MTEQEQLWLTERVGALEETLSGLLSFLRENSNTTSGYLWYKNLLDTAILKGKDADKVYNKSK